MRLAFAFREMRKGLFSLTICFILVTAACGGTATNGTGGGLTGHDDAAPMSSDPVPDAGTADSGRPASPMPDAAIRDAATPDAGSTSRCPALDAGTASPPGATLDFLAICHSHSECKSGLCFMFNGRGTRCTIPCNMNCQCAAPSSGCNNMGVCKAP